MKLRIIPVAFKAIFTPSALPSFVYHPTLGSTLLCLPPNTRVYSALSTTKHSGLLCSVYHPTLGSTLLTKSLFTFSVLFRTSPFLTLSMCATPNILSNTFPPHSFFFSMELSCPKVLHHTILLPRLYTNRLFLSSHSKALYALTRYCYFID